MSEALPHRPSIDHTPYERLTIDLGSDDATGVLGALGTGTARSILRELAAEPGTASDLAEAVDTSVQNVHYHLSNLRAAGLVSEVGTWHSEKGAAMCVYGPTAERLTVRITADGEHET